MRAPLFENGLSLIEGSPYSTYVRGSDGVLHTAPPADAVRDVTELAKSLGGRVRKSPKGLVASFSDMHASVRFKAGLRLISVYDDDLYYRDSLKRGKIHYTFVTLNQQ